LIGCHNLSINKIKKDSTISNNRLDFIRDANVTRKDARTDRMEDYLEVIYELIKQKGYASTVDISNYLNIRSPSVTKMIQRLDESGYLNYEKYRGINLTDDRIRIAKSIRNRHEILAEFFRMIGVDKEIANNDAEGIEHHLHHERLKKWKNL
jgi:DtxR family transcriptional regulator, manganese transport regulator